ncbi:hypothetical protein [Paraliomyxa miuraensis]|uniref:hypothetical protein n=1 Tax=Paraliomyxa miuraensis TaxID=376150 RepID=UPI0022581228|nr:hypothetical protein [Paraliomyxa miuraensis]MCX4244750.1 hypothetical protein [Paraliomyxa miuraensis]
MATSLLEPVSAGQTRFRMQGLAPDARGIAVGREVLVTFPTIDWLVAFLGAFSDESNLDDLLPTMTLEHSRRQEGGHAILLRAAAGDGYAVDRLARIAGATRGQLFTGSGSVFVRWRGREAPFGYDLVSPMAASGEEVLVVDIDYVATYAAVDRMDPVELIQRLQLRRVPLPLSGISGEAERCGIKDLALALVAPGLASRVLRHLWRLEANFAGYYVTLEGDAGASLLLRIRHPRGRVLDVLHGTPGVELLAPASSRAAVQLGYRHPIQLASASACLPGEEMFLFRGDVGRVERLPGPPRFVDGRHLVEATGTAHLRELGQLREAELEPLQVELQVRPASNPREPRGALIAWEQVALLRHLVYLIPPSALAASRVVPLDEGLVVITGSSIGNRGRAAAVAGMGAGAIVPLGRRLGEVAPGVLVADGYELWPRVRPALTRQLLGLGPDDHALFLRPDTDPIRVTEAQLLPLDAALIGRLRLSDATTVAPELPALTPGQVENRKLGRFALWGFGGPPKGPEDEGRGQ